MKAFYKNPKIYLSVIILACIYWALSRPSAENQIRTQLEALRAVAETDHRLTQIEAAERTKQIVSYMDEQVSFELVFKDYEKIEVVTRKELRKKFLAGYTQLSSLEVEISNLSISIDDQNANVDLDLSLLGAIGGVNGQFLEMHRVRVELIKTFNNWAISSLSHLENLRE